jgi:hypothetical protein
MNVKQLIAIIAVFSATGTAFAQQAEVVPRDTNFLSTNTGDEGRYDGVANVTFAKTRVQVMSELEEARTQGLMNWSDATYPRPIASVRAPEQKARVEVIAELDAARAQGLLNSTDATYPVVASSRPAALQKIGLQVSAERNRTGDPDLMN